MIINKVNYLDKDVKQYFIDDCKTLYRYMDYEKLEDKKLWVSNPSSWKDPYETLFLDSEYLFRGKRKEKHKYYNRVFCICLTTTNLSEAAWKVYGTPTKFSVDTMLLRKILEEQSKNYEIFIGKVSYVSQTSLKKESIYKLLNEDQIRFDCSEPWIRLLLLKRMAYKYEDEIRIFFVSKDINECKGLCLEHTYEIRELYKHVELSPLITYEKASSVERYLIRKFKYEKKQIHNCHLYDSVEPRRLKCFSWR